VSPARQLADYEAAVAFVQAQLADQVDTGRINLWGTSLSGGHVLTLAGTSLADSVTSVIAQVGVCTCVCDSG
jgi:dienelactone hydrolase